MALEASIEMFSFCFNFQEELSFVFEMLGLYEEALIQYDEIDALLTQLVINSKFKGTGRCHVLFFFVVTVSRRLECHGRLEILTTVYS